MLLKLLMRVIVVAIDSGVFEGAIHAFHLPIGLRMVGLGQPMLNAIC